MSNVDERVIKVIGEVVNTGIAVQKGMTLKELGYDSLKNGSSYRRTPRSGGHAFFLFPAALTAVPLSFPIPLYVTCFLSCHLS